MNPTRERIRSLVDIVEESGLETLYNVMLRFIPEDEPLIDEIESHKIGREEFVRGEYVSIDEVNWD
ncbi:MAG: hypothetical protein FWC69_05120 [Defluviitaleaceae bacterium]|nr:hypothetical protein [Defluviitaleaceae bacterium]